MSPSWHAGRLLFLCRYQPPPQITAAPLEPVDTSTWSCCYRGWEPRGQSTGAGTSSLAGSWEEPHSCPLLPPRPLGSKSTLRILLRLLITLPRSTPGTPQDSGLLPERSPGSAPEPPHQTGSGSDLQLYCSPWTRTPSAPSSLVSFPF